MDQCRSTRKRLGDIDWVLAHEPHGDAILAEADALPAKLFGRPFRASAGPGGWDSGSNGMGPAALACPLAGPGCLRKPTARRGMLGLPRKFRLVGRR